MKQLKCKCGKCVMWTSYGVAYDCQGCYECQTTYSDYPEGHKELQPHSWEIKYHENTGKPYFLCAKCGQIDEPTYQAAAKITTPEEDKERYQANMQYLYEQEIKDTERFVEYMKKKKEEGFIFTPPLEEDGLVIELPPDDEIDDDGNLVDDPSLEDLPIPTNLDEAIEALANQENLEFIQKCTEDEFIGQTHHGFGTGIRNGWGLWTGSVLAKWFNEKGIYHADDMSGIILTSCYRKGTGKDIDLEGQIKRYRKYWSKVDPKVNERK